MAISEPPIPGSIPTALISSAAQLVEAARQQNAATLAAAIITASNRPWSARQAIDLVSDIRFALYPNPNNGAYQEWAKTRDVRLGRVHGDTT
jgi:hypothetical protein